MRSTDEAAKATGGASSAVTYDLSEAIVHDSRFPKAETDHGAVLGGPRLSSSLSALGSDLSPTPPAALVALAPTVFPSSTVVQQFDRKIESKLSTIN